MTEPTEAPTSTRLDPRPAHVVHRCQWGRTPERALCGHIPASGEIPRREAMENPCPMCMDVVASRTPCPYCGQVVRA